MSLVTLAVGRSTASVLCYIQLPLWRSYAQDDANPNMPTPPQQMTVWLCERYHVPITHLHQVDRCSNTITQPITVHDANDISKCNLRIPRPLYERCPDHRTPYKSQPEYDSMLRASTLVTLQQLGFTTAVTSEIGTPLQQGQTAESQLCLPQRVPLYLCQ